jgi:hypothetical protein
MALTRCIAPRRSWRSERSAWDSRRSSVCWKGTRAVWSSPWLRTRQRSKANCASGNGERFELREIRPITYIVGSLGSGKTRLVRCLAAALPNASFLGIERLTDGGASAVAGLSSDPTLKARVDQSLARLVDDGAAASDALITLLAGLEAEQPTAVVVDMVEQGLDQPTQEALIAHLRLRAKAGARPLFLMTRSSAILDLSAVGPDESALFCPANHSPPVRVVPYSGAPGLEAVSMCLGSPEARARTAGMIAWRSAV